MILTTLKEQIIFIAITLVLCGCGKVQSKKTENDLANAEVYNYTLRLEQVSHLLDSVSKKEKVIDKKLVQGTEFIDHLDRIRGYEAFVEYTRQKVLRLEKDLGSTEQQDDLLQNKIALYHQKLEVKDSIIQRLSLQVTSFKGEKNQLIRKEDLQQYKITRLIDSKVITEKEQGDINGSKNNLIFAKIQ